MADITGSVINAGPVITDVTGVSLTTSGVFVLSNNRSKLSPTVTSTLSLNSIATSYNSTGPFLYASTRPKVTGVISSSLSQVGAGASVPVPVPTRQLLIR